MAQYNSAELFPIVDENGNVVGSAPRSVCHNGIDKPLHPVVHLHVIGLVDGSPAILLQQRAMTKDIQPGKWDTTVGGHVDYGEQIEEALIRESYEEIGLPPMPGLAVELGRYQFESDRERELVNVFALQVDPSVFEVRYAEDEISDMCFMTFGEVDALTGTGKLTPNFEQEFGRIRNQLLEMLL